MTDVPEILEKKGYEKRAKLLKSPVDEYDEDLFLEAVNESYQMSRENSEAFSNRCERKDAPEKITEIEDLYKIPLVDMIEFKDRKRSNMIKTRENDSYLLTSGTSTDTRGNVPVSELGMEVRREVSRKIAGERYPDSDGVAVLSLKPEILEMDGVPEQVSNRYIFNILPSYYNQFDGSYMIGLEDGKPSLDIEQVVDYLGEGKGLAGVPSKLMPVLDYLNENGESLQMGENGFIATGGGWKGMEGISNKDFREKASKLLGIPKENHVDNYAATEFTGNFANNYNDENPDLKRTSSYFFAYTVNEEKFLDKNKVEPSDSGEGVLAIIDPLNTDIPGMILTDDVVRKTGGEYGEDVRIEHLGRSSM